MFTTGAAVLGLSHERKALVSIVKATSARNYISDLMQIVYLKQKIKFGSDKIKPERYN